MNSIRRPLAALALVLALVLTAIGAPAHPALAQDDPPGCRGLSADDCALLQSATLATQNVVSLNIPAWAVTLYMAAEQETIFVQAGGTAAYALPEELVLLRDTFMSVETVTPNTIIAFLGQIDANRIQTMLDELLLSITVDPLIVESPEATVTASGALVYKDSTIYLNLPAPSGENIWFGQPITLTFADLDEIDAALEELRASFDAPEIDEAFDEMGASLLMQQQIAALAERHTTTTRLSDEMLDGQIMAAVFTSTFNVKDLLADPDLAPALIAAFDELAAQDPEIEPLDMNEAQLTLMLTAFNLLVSEGTITNSQWVGLDDGYVLRSTVDITFNIDPSLLAESTTDPVDPIVFDLSAAIAFDDFDALTPDQVTAPDTYYPGDLLGDFLVGTPDMIEQVVAVGETVQNEIPFDGDTHIYALPLEAGQTVVLSLESDGYPYLSVYNPDAFRVEMHSIFSGEPLVFTASEDGVHFVTVEGFSELTYTLTITEAEG